MLTDVRKINGTLFICIQWQKWRDKHLISFNSSQPFAFTFDCLFVYLPFLTYDNIFSPLSFSTYWGDWSETCRRASIHYHNDVERMLCVIQIIIWVSWRFLSHKITISFLYNITCENLSHKIGSLIASMTGSSIGGEEFLSFLKKNCL